MHIHLHAKSQAHMSDKQVDKDQARRKMQKHQLLGLVDNLASAVEKLSWQPEQTSWAEYEKFHNYSAQAQQHKHDLVQKFLAKTDSSMVWDLGANIGYFSRIASQQGIDTVAFDIDPGAVELNYLKLVEQDERHMLPLVMDLTNPSPGLGWNSSERDSFQDRGPADTVLALALIHHLAIGNNVPLPQLASFFAGLCRWLIIEFVPKRDPQVGKLLQVREDIFSGYNQENFVTVFKSRFDLLSEENIVDSERSLYLFKRKE
jgi:ribosomal protein L11 methylase PrmA